MKRKFTQGSTMAQCCACSDAPRQDLQYQRQSAQDQERKEREKADRKLILATIFNSSATLGEIDQDGDGFVSRNEFLEWVQDDTALANRLPERTLDAFFDSMDQNSDGKVSFAEWSSSMFRDHKVRFDVIAAACEAEGAEHFSGMDSREFRREFAEELEEGQLKSEDLELFFNFAASRNHGERTRGRVDGDLLQRILDTHQPLPEGDDYQQGSKSRGADPDNPEQDEDVWDETWEGRGFEETAGGLAEYWQAGMDVLNTFILDAQNGKGFGEIWMEHANVFRSLGMGLLGFLVAYYTADMFDTMVLVALFVAIIGGVLYACYACWLGAEAHKMVYGLNQKAAAIAEEHNVDGQLDGVLQKLDYNGDGVTDMADLQMLLSQFNMSSTAYVLVGSDITAATVGLGLGLLLLSDTGEFIRDMIPFLF